ncbi:hotdog fold thioesterase [Salinicola corii]|uniref:Hotdog fold thioesterase n=1 Tax=Salinicola corii TaxID=2606937 RepID=A0A640WF46_9GAMM|nr:hotdog fold thioesterase [Salinicola corii]KAA0018758.1 hotdog fold thioesterase [Salinicola corii]
MPIWKRESSLEALEAECRDTLVAHIGIEFTELGDDCLRGRMPVDARTHQPYGLLHGGASVVLAETLGSIAANLCLADESKMAVGLEINANHVRAVRQGWVEGCARPLHIGGTTQLWEIRIEDERGRLVCMSRLTMAVVNRG